MDLNFREPVPDRALDDSGRPPDPLLLGNSGWLLELLDQRSFLCFRGCYRTLPLVSFCHFRFSHLEQRICCVR